MKFSPCNLPEVILIEPKVWRDERGFFLEVYHQRKFRDGGIDVNFVQDNHSRSAQNILRGLHAQLGEQAQGKLVRVIAGEVFDVAVDIRSGSPRFGQWCGELLSAENFKQLWIPPGFAHGFLVLSAAADVEYKCTQLYDPAAEITVRWNDPAIGIDWPLVGEPLLSEKDRRGKLLSELENQLPAYNH